MKSDSEKKDKWHKFTMWVVSIFILIGLIMCIVGVVLDIQEYNDSTPEEYLELDVGTVEESAALVHKVCDLLMISYMLIFIVLGFSFWEYNEKYKLKKEIEELQLKIEGK